MLRVKSCAVDLDAWAGIRPGAGLSETGCEQPRPRAGHRDRDRDVRIRHRSDRRSVAGSRCWGRGAHMGRTGGNGLWRKNIFSYSY